MATHQQVVSRSGAAAEIGMYLDARMVPTTALRESPWSPRTYFDEVELAALADSIKAVGIMQPLIVRPERHGVDQYEVGAGHRRLRAARMSNITLVPVIVRTMDDSTFREFLIFENLNREGLHELEECAAFADLLTNGWSIAAIAVKVGKDESYVNRRLSLAKLIDEARELFFARRIHLDHALELARIQPADQKHALSWLMKGRNDAYIEGHGHVEDKEKRPRSATLLRTYIRETVLLARKFEYPK